MPAALQMFQEECVLFKMINLTADFMWFKEECGID